jgi:hypothetical protein
VAVIRQALAALFSGGVVEVRALGDYATHSGYFDDFAKLAACAEALDADPEVRGIYVTLNEVNRALLARRANRVKMRLTRSDPTTSDADILRRRWLPIDLDPVRPSGVSSTEEEHAAALRRADEIALWLNEQGFPHPIRADSGNGAHLLYAIDLANDDEATALVKGVLATLDALFSDERVTVDTANVNAARIWKLYGTCSRKGDNTPERPHRRAKLLSVPAERTVVAAGKLRAIANRLPVEAPAPTGSKIDLGKWLREHGLAVRSTRPWQGGTLYVLEDCPFSTAHRDGAFAVQFPSGAIYAGCHHASCGGGVQRWPELRERYEPREKRAQRRKREEVPPPPSSPPAPAPAYREKALDILTRGDPLAFLLDTFNREHVGDRTVAECLALSLASQSVENTNGLHVSVSGTSGKGKSHACTTMLEQVPEGYRLAGTVSNKALYYNDDLQPGTVFLFDDVTLSEDLQEVLKAATANFRERIEHQTVTADRKLQVCRIPERCVWWLAKVEDSGDDQVMNRMLTVWIDDSIEQDERVLQHMKEKEAREDGGDDEDPALPVCRAIWDVLKEERLHVSIPYAETVHFSATTNRRNPGMLFDLIKCHALLFRFQRETYDGGIRADRSDFAAAARIYAAINGEAGGQETKLTKNEAAALETVKTMGWTVFTARMLQEALGLSYHQTRRILHGYNNGGTTYSGLLEKCPAVGFVDTTISEDVDGYLVRRREYQYSFNPEIYRRWAGGAHVWIDPDPPDDDGTFAPHVHRSCTEKVQRTGTEEKGQTDYSQERRESSLSHSTILHQKGDTRTPPDPPVSAGDCVCDPRQSANDRDNEGERAGMFNPDAKIHPFGGTVKVHVSANQCTGANEVVPLQGVLDHREFTRTKTDLGRCSVCDEGRTVFRSGDGMVRLCERCYRQLVRGWNEKKGVGR